MLLAFFAASAWPSPAEPEEPVLSTGGLTARFARGGVTVAGLGTTRVSLAAWGRATAMVDAGESVPKVVDDLVIHPRAGIDEWWVAGADGLEHGFWIPAPPLGAGPLFLDLAIAGAPVAVANGEARFSGMRYFGLFAFDEAGAPLPAWMEATADGIRLVVDDAAARGGVWVDPYLHLAWTAESNIANGYYGWGLAAGDFNGDGFDDLAVGDNTHQPDVYLGSAQGLSGTPDWTVYASGIAGFALSAGDFDADGRDDLLVGGPWWGNDGEVYVYPGTPAGLEVIPTTFGNSQLGGNLGYSVSSAGDVNGDGYDDAIVGAYGATNPEFEEGAAFVYHGGPAGLVTVPAWSTESNQASAWLGYAVAGVGDVNGDGYDDVVVGAPYLDAGQVQEGRVLLHLGSAAGVNPVPAWTSDSNQANAHYGDSLAGAGDVNGDGYDDVLVGASLYDNPSTNEGKAWLYLGSAAGLTVAAWSAEGDAPYAAFGQVSGAGDVDGDGYRDVLVGGSLLSAGQAEEGMVRLYLGNSTGLSPTPAWIGQSNQVQAYYGSSLAPAGDIDGDGYADFAISAPWFDAGHTDEGRTWLYLGGCIDTSGTDGDGDGVGDTCDLCPRFDDLIDADLDDVADACDVCAGDDLDDRDDDRIPDACDPCPDGYDPSQADTDGDGANDACDRCEGHDDAIDADGDTIPDPCDVCADADDRIDRDADGVADACDLCEGFDDLDDQDADGLPFGCDNCPDDPDPDQTDLDGDGSGAPCEACPGFDDSLDADLDAVPDDCDRCPGEDDALDADLDAFPDACDTCPGADDALDADVDLLPDGCDNCPRFGGGTQDDADLDGAGDPCDACPGEDDRLDADLDEAPDACDACPGEDDRLDDDADAVPDACDRCGLGDDAVDGDEDGVPDACDLCPNEDDGVDPDADGFPRCAGDCWEGDPAVYPGAPEFADGVDQDCDGRVDDGTEWADDDADGASEVGGDCADDDPTRHPGAAEACDGLDQDCDGVPDDGTPCGDDDGDGYAEVEGDCADGDPLVAPGAIEFPSDGIDNDCDGVVDPGHWDPDGDGVIEGDCEPEDPEVFAGNVESENGEDDDCDGVTDEGTAVFDDDGDGLAEADGDCDDTNAAVFPGASETPDGRDQDCDREIDEGTAIADDDTDGFTEAGGDCDDARDDTHPGATEVNNGRDDDCDGRIDEPPDDVDGDGWTVAEGDCDDQNGWRNPEQTEICDLLDNDCDGQVNFFACVRWELPEPGRAPTGCRHAVLGPSPALLAVAALALRPRRRQGRRVR